MMKKSYNCTEYGHLLMGSGPRCHKCGRARVGLSEQQSFAGERNRLPGKNKNRLLIINFAALSFTLLAFLDWSLIASLEGEILSPFPYIMAIFTVIWSVRANLRGGAGVLSAQGDQNTDIH